MGAPRQRHWMKGTSERDRRIIALGREGVSSRTVGERCGVSQATAARVIRQARIDAYGPDATSASTSLARSQARHLPAPSPPSTLPAPVPDLPDGVEDAAELGRVAGLAHLLAELPAVAAAVARGGGRVVDGYGWASSTNGLADPPLVLLLTACSIPVELAAVVWEAVVSADGSLDAQPLDARLADGIALLDATAAELRALASRVS